ncbi:amidohydrolase family protein [Croceicoccus sediminis]|uniref:amidohydrolase family protein n=1 Tax=Croceicoccus sediminis TaxID=2571150 RepID=UPI0014781644|nr:amidohydrolase family protein [Croceicoccus sediminis]
MPLKPTREIAFDVEEGTALQPDLSPDGRWIVFAMLGDLYVLPAEGGEARAITRGMAFDTQPVFAPDGKSIAFLSDRSGAENLWVVRPDGTEARQVSFYDDDPIFTSPSWSADGLSLTVSRYWPDRNAYELWRFDASRGGMGKAIIANRTEGDDRLHHALGAVTSPDGRYLYYASRGGDLNLAEPVEWQIVRREIQTGEVDVLVEAVGDIRLGKIQSSAFRPVISHNGERLAYVEWRPGAAVLRLLDLKTGELTDLAPLDPVSLQASYWSDIAPRFAFSPDDKAVVFSAGGQFRRIDLASRQISTIPFRARVQAELAPLARAPARVETGPVHVRILQNASLSPDGEMLAFSALGKIYLMPSAGGEARMLAPDLPPQFHPAWSRDGNSLIFVSWTAREGGHVWRHDLATGKSVRLTNAHAFYTHPVATPDGGILVIRSSTADRLATYLEFGQFRDAELVQIRADGSEQVMASGMMGGTPQILFDGTILLNRPSGVYGVRDDSLRVAVEGPNWYFSEGPAQADDIRVSPDGKYALAQIAQQLHLISIPEEGGRTVSLTSSAVGHEQVSTVGADYFGWSDDGRSYFWSIGSTFHFRELDNSSDRTITADITVPRDITKGQLLLEGATVITMGPAGTIADAEILVGNDRIVAIGPRGTLAVPADAERRDVSGAYIIPGLIDVHDHVADIRRDVLDFEAWGPAANLAYGVTTAFDPSTLSIDMLAYQDAIDAGLMTGSRIFSTGPALFSFNDFRSYDQVESVLRRYRDHYRLTNIKMYRTGNRRVRQWIVQAARKLGLQPTTEGALAMKLDLSQVLDGYAGNEHAIPPPVHYADLSKLLARSGVSYDLTLQITHGGYPAQDYFIARDTPHGDAKYARFAPPWFRDQRFWQREWTDPKGYIFPQVAASAARFVRYGGLLAIGAHGEVPGLGTHWEMQAYAMGGMTPSEILAAATIDGARAIGRSADLGSLEPGKLADLVILAKDPRETIANTLSLTHVMKGGKLYDAGTIASVWPEAGPPPQFWFNEGGTARANAPD